MTSPDHKTWQVPAWAWLPIGLAIIASAAINALRAYGLGQQLEHFTVDVSSLGLSATVSLAGAVLVVAAIALELAQARAAWVAFRPGAMARQRVIAAPIAILLLAVSVSALALTLLEAQRGKSGDEGSQRTAYDAVKAEYLRAEAELNRLDGARTPDEIKTAMGAAPVSRLVFRRTAECTDITKQESFDACKPILDLRQEMARAIRKIELDAAVPVLKVKLDALPRPAEASAVELLMGSVWGWIMGLAVVLVATFGAPLFAVPGVTPNVSPLSDPERLGSVSRSAPKISDRSAPQAGASNGSANNSELGGAVIAFPKVRKVSASNGSVGAAVNSDAERRARVLAFIKAAAASGTRIERQATIGEALRIPASTLSEILAGLEADGMIERKDRWPSEGHHGSHESMLSPSRPSGRMVRRNEQNLSTPSQLYGRLANGANMEDVPLQISVNRACFLLGVCRQTLYKMRKDGKLAFGKSCGRTMVPMSEVMRLHNQIYETTQVPVRSELQESVTPMPKSRPKKVKLTPRGDGDNRSRPHSFHLCDDD